VRKRFLGALLLSAQAALGARVVWRLVRTGGAGRLDAGRRASAAADAGAVSILVPVLDEAQRLSACLDALVTVEPLVGEIVVVDGGSTDSTLALAQAAARHESRVRVVAAGRAPADWNGKVWGLAAGAAAANPRATWLLTIDADVLVQPGLATALWSTARARHVRLLSAAAPQHVAEPLDGLLHPALLTTLVYRFGRPNTVTSDVAVVQANGQCCLLRRDLLAELGGFESVRASLNEDVTLARRAAAQGDSVGFFEAPGRLDVTMYTSAAETWRNWPRSLALRDRYAGWAGWLGLLEVLAVQALPLPQVLWGPPGASRRLAIAWLALRLGLLAGIARAYPGRPPTYWLSPLLDLPAALAVCASALRRHHVWRGRPLVRAGWAA
jgi:dolichol-phosphate mannosyltransferase